MKPKGVSTAAELAISQGKASSIMANASAEETHPKGKGKKNRKIIRMAGGQTWEDQSLLDWDDGKKIFLYSIISLCFSNWTLEKWKLKVQILMEWKKLQMTSGYFAEIWATT